MTEYRFNTIEQIESYLESIPKFSTSGISAANFNLARMRKFCTKMDNPEKNFYSIHVAGTNGKGTTCQMLASVYQSAGYKTALYTSPHLTDVKERFKVNGLCMDNANLLEFFRLYGVILNEEPLTFFELTTAIAFWYFKKAGAEIAIIETGLGGRLDATNVITPLVSVITSVGIDHAEILGSTISEISREKAGIIKPKKPVVVGNLQNDADNVVREVAKLNQSVLFSASDCNPEFNSGKIHLRTAKGSITLRAVSRKKIDAVNAAVAYLSVQAARDQLPVSERDFKEGIELVDQRFPFHAHFEKLLQNREWYFDGAHNPEAVKVLTEELLSRAPAEHWTVVLSFMKDKLNNEIADEWKPFPNIILYSQNTERAAGIAEMKTFFPKASAITDKNRSVKTLMEQSKSELVIFSGSFYFYNKVRRWMGTMAAK